MCVVDFVVVCCCVSIVPFLLCVSSSSSSSSSCLSLLLPTLRVIKFPIRVHVSGVSCRLGEKIGSPQVPHLVQDSRPLLRQQQQHASDCIGTPIVVDSVFTVCLCIGGCPLSLAVIDFFSLSLGLRWRWPARPRGMITLRSRKKRRIRPASLTDAQQHHLLISDHQCLQGSQLGNLLCGSPQERSCHPLTDDLWL